MSITIAAHTVGSKAPKMIPDDCEFCVFSTLVNTTTLSNPLSGRNLTWPCVFPRSEKAPMTNVQLHFL